MTADRLAPAAAEQAWVAARGPAPRARRRLGTAVLADAGVPTPWSVRAVLPPGSDAAEEALAWCRDRHGGRGFGLLVRRSDVRARLSRLPDGDRLQPVDVLPVLALTDPDALETAAPAPPGVRISTDPPHDDVVTAYGGWMDDLSLARCLVTPEDLSEAARRFLVAYKDGRPVGCALLWLVAGTVALSGLGVVAEQRGRGVGAALVGAGVGVARQVADPDVVWMHATSPGARLYRRLGFVHVDDHVVLGEGPEGPWAGGTAAGRQQA